MEPSEENLACAVRTAFLRESTSAVRFLMMAEYSAGSGAALLLWEEDEQDKGQNADSYMRL